MKGKFVFRPILGVFSFLLISHFLIGQESFTISGFIEDLSSGERLIQANIVDVDNNTGSVSNSFGFYSITMPKGQHTLAVTYVGYQKMTQVIDLNKDTTITWRLDPNVSLETVEVTAESVKRLQDESQMSTIEIPMQQLKKIPALLGEVDVLKALQLLPGVQSGGEGQSGLYVRGGSPDQNLILLDGVPIYNASHLFGFFSVFNADAIKDVKLIKGGFPARYGGRLSSVIDIAMKDGHKDEFHGNVSVGVVATKATLEGPLIKDKTSFLVSARRTYLDILTRPIIKESFRSNDSEGVVGYYFYDVNAKVNHKFSDKDQLFVSFYNGLDKFYLEETYKTDNFEDHNEAKWGWGNNILALRWNRVWRPKLFSNSTLTYSTYTLNNDINFQYKDKVNDYRELSELGYLSGIRDYTAKMDWDYLPTSDHFVKFGASAIYHEFLPGTFDLKFEDTSGDTQIDTSLGQKNLYATEVAIYAEDDWRVNDKLKVNFGVHGSAFFVDGEPYYSLQPRVSARYLLPGDMALKASYAEMQQYIHLLAFEGIGLPTDQWVPTTKNVKPQTSRQVALGLAKTFDLKYEVSLEGYYKTLKNVISYKEGASLFQFNDWQDRVTQGDGESYGLEFFVQKKTGRLSGWLGYTLSWTYRQFDDLNEGRKYSYRYDRRHDLSLVASYQLSEKVNLSGSWVYGTGNAITLAGTKFYSGHPSYLDQFIGSEPTDYYGEKNNFRMRSYHRLDIGIDLIKKTDSYTRKWSFGAYNAYNRKNPFFLYYDREYTFTPGGGEESETVLKQASLFPVIPYVTWSIDF